HELVWTLVAALQAVEAKVPPALAELAVDHGPAIAERAKVLKKQLSRKARSVVQQAAQRPNELFGVEDMRSAALAAGQRAGLLWSGDLSIALSVLDVGKGGRALV